MTEHEAELRDEAERCLRALAGEHARLREDQWTAIRALVADRRRALVVQRTGWGKSAVYFIATALLRARGAGPTVIVSPLIALMRNQVEAAGRAGIRARTASRSELRDSPRSAARSASRGSRSPARSAPDVIMALIFSMASSVTAKPCLRAVKQGRSPPGEIRCLPRV